VSGSRRAGGVLRLGSGFARRGTAYEAMGTDAKKGYPKDQGIKEFQSKEEAAQYVIDTIEYINDVESITFVE
jgi:hypothetical protein